MTRGRRSGRCGPTWLDASRSRRSGPWIGHMAGASSMYAAKVWTTGRVARRTRERRDRRRTSMATEPDLYVGKEPATFDFDGAPVFIGPTIVVRAGHPIMRGREGLFVPLVVHYDVVPAPEPKATSKAAGTKTAEKKRS